MCNESICQTRDNIHNLLEHELKNEPWQNIPSREKSGSWESNHMRASLFMNALSVYCTFLDSFKLFLWCYWKNEEGLGSRILIWLLLGIHGRIWRRIGVLFDLFRGTSYPAQYINNVYLSESKRSRECLSKMMGLSILFHDGWECV